jgi:hypothetical protein
VVTEPEHIPLDQERILQTAACSRQASLLLLKCWLVWLKGEALSSQPFLIVVKWKAVVQSDDPPTTWQVPMWWPQLKQQQPQGFDAAVHSGMPWCQY